MLTDLHPQRIFTNGYIHIDLDKKRSYIATEWLQHPSSEVFRRNMMLCAGLIREHRCQYCLSDARRVLYLEVADQNWVVREFIPHILSTSKRFARVMTRDGLAMMDMHRVRSKICEEQMLATEDQIGMFLDKESALEWLLEAQAPALDSTVPGYHSTRRR